MFDDRNSFAQYKLVCYQLIRCVLSVHWSRDFPFSYTPKLFVHDSKFFAVVHELFRSLSIFTELFFTWIFSCLLCYLIHKTFLARQTHRRGWKFIFWIMMSFECLKNDKRESIKSRWSWYRRIGTTKFKFIQLKFKRQRKSQNL